MYNDYVHMYNFIIYTLLHLNKFFIILLSTERKREKEKKREILLSKLKFFYSY